MPILGQIRHDNSEIIFVRYRGLKMCFSDGETVSAVFCRRPCALARTEGKIGDHRTEVQ